MKRFAACIVTALVATGVGTATAGPTLVVAQDGFGSPKDCEAPIATPYTTIGAAVAAAQPGDVIKVCPGVYNEQVAINKSVTLRGDNGAVVKPSPMSANTTSLTTGFPLAVVILVENASKVVLEGLTITGANRAIVGCPSASTPSLFGIFYRNASGAIRNNAIRGMRLGPADAACDSGTGILIQSGGGGASVMSIEGNSIHNYQKNGVTANEAGTDVRIGKRNVVTGSGPTTGAVQNGIQLAFGATGVVEDNIVTDNISADCIDPVNCPSSANDVIIFDSGAVRVGRNVLGRSQAGVTVIGDGNRVTGNVIFDTHVFDGVAVFGNDNEIQDNDITRSDESGIFLQGDNNKVRDNRINEAPVGILKAGSGNVFSGNTFYNTPTPDPPAPPIPARVSPQR